MAKIVLKYDQKSLPEKTSVFSPTCCCLAFRTLALISFYFILSIGLTFYQRWILQELHFPLSMVVCHLSIKFMLAGLCRTVWEWRTHQPRVILEWGPYITRVGPTGVASGLDVGFSNWGLNLITVSLYTMTKSTVIIFILGFALLFKLEKKSWTLILIVTMISSGLFLFTYEATEFNMKGFLLVLAASFASGLRWTLAQLVMQKSKLGLSNPLDMVYHVQPFMIIALLPFAIGFEGHLVASSCRVFRYHDVHVLLNTMGKVLLGSLVAFLMENSEFLLVSQTSSLTLSVAGICKEVLTMVLAVEWAGDQMNSMKFIGLLLCLGGISYHSFQKVLTGSQEGSANSVNANNSELQIPLLSDSGSVGARFLADHLTNSDSESDEDSTNVLFNVLQRRDNNR